MRLVAAVAFAVLLPVALLEVACSFKKTPPSCESAGGRCLVGPAICAVQGTQLCPGADTPAGPFCCLAQTADCGQPAETEWTSCDGGTPACNGTPSLLGGPAGADGSFPVGCTAVLPVCNAGDVVRCTCQGASWSCTL